jgi:signal transduction histidine kinase
MRSNIIEWIRKILIRTILPIRKRKELFLSQFYFSIAFRISLNYLRLLIINAVIFVFLFIGVYLGVALFDHTDMKKDFIADIKSEKAFILKEGLNTYSNNGFEVRIAESKSKQVVYDDIAFNISKENLLFNRIYYNTIEGESYLIITDRDSCTINGVKYNLYFQYDLSNEREQLGRLLPFVIILLAFMTACVIIYAKKGDEKLFTPIRDMSKLANRLTVKNIQSERINIAGTKNELKELAETINEMLNRIEISYESQKQFVSDASHELRTPIAVIQGYANLLDRWGKKDEAVLEESIEAIRNEAKSMQELVEKLLFLSRHDKKTLKLEKHKFNMRPIVEDMVKETRMVVKERVINSPSLEDVIVYGDKQALKQAIRIFIDNAVKYSSAGDEINISCENHGGDCILTVQDTGIGMTRKDIDNIFERFYRSDHVRDRKINGHGLGLSIAKLIILKHTGSIKVRSQYTKGSSFIVTIPKRELN